MIYESWFWKEEIKALAKQFEKTSNNLGRSTTSFEKAGFRIERSVFYSALAIRRLCESHKITDRLQGRKISLESYPSKTQDLESLIDSFGIHDLDRYFDFSKASKLSFTPTKLASEVIHSFVLALFTDESGRVLESIVVASEKNRHVRAVKIGKSDWLELLQSFADDRVKEVTMKWDVDNPKIKLG